MCLKEGTAASHSPASGDDRSTSSQESGHWMKRRRASMSQEASARTDIAVSSSTEEGAANATVSPASQEPRKRIKRQGTSKLAEALVRANTAKAVTWLVGLTSSLQADLVKKVISDSDDESRETLQSGRMTVGPVSEPTLRYPKSVPKTLSKKIDSSTRTLRSEGVTADSENGPSPPPISSYLESLKPKG
ncbi:uncharacterized protein TrAFT101_005555 [Trichoderma asperellum]|uniref:uncharacterized protein n=1 Tax=Trichoderma asperellum TaxID=101201 RepID=UPI003328573E|nr:hypothetical protein TrAFT101_005555 [Trichoderma asperellum]